MLKSKHFKTEQALIEWANDIFGDETEPQWDKVKSIIKDHTNGDWIIFYIEEK